MNTFDLLLNIFLFVLAFTIPIIILFSILNFLLWKFMIDTNNQLEEMRKELLQKIDDGFKKMF